MTKFQQCESSTSNMSKTNLPTLCGCVDRKMVGVTVSNWLIVFEPFYEPLEWVHFGFLPQKHHELKLVFVWLLMYEMNSGFDEFNCITNSVLSEGAQDWYHLEKILSWHSNTLGPSLWPRDIWFMVPEKRKMKKKTRDINKEKNVIMTFKIGK